MGLGAVAQRIAAERGHGTFVSPAPASDVVRVHMTPQQYLDIEQKQRMGYADNYFSRLHQAEYDTGSPQAVRWRKRVDRRLASKMWRGLPIPAPWFGLSGNVYHSDAQPEWRPADMARFSIKGQEGRHRANIARQLNVPLMPVDLHLDSGLRSSLALGAHRGDENTPTLQAGLRKLTEALRQGSTKTTHALRAL